MATVGLLSALVWWYASYRGRLLRQPLSVKALRLTWVRALTAPAIYLLSIPLAMLNDDLARGSWILIALAIIVEGRPEAVADAPASPGIEDSSGLRG
jgi:O-antigen/teichoic acid export membrane protein